jgi:hypothetical protein
MSRDVFLAHFVFEHVAGRAEDLRRNLWGGDGFEESKRRQREKLVLNGGVEIMVSKKLAVVLGVAMSAGMLVAQTSGTQATGSATDAQASSAQAGGGKARHREMNPDKAAERLGKKLNLSADQVAQIKPILADQKQQMGALRADTSLTKEDRHAKAKGIMQDSGTKLEAVMNDQQKQQFEQMLSERKAKRQARNEKPQAQ